MLGKDRVRNTLMIVNMITMVILAIIILEVVVLISGLLSLFVELGDYVNAEKIFLSLRFCAGRPNKDRLVLWQQILGTNFIVQ